MSETFRGATYWVMLDLNGELAIDWISQMRPTVLKSQAEKGWRATEVTLRLAGEVAVADLMQLTNARFNDLEVVEIRQEKWTWAGFTVVGTVLAMLIYRSLVVWKHLGF